MARKRFNTRAFTSIYLVTSGLFITLTGIILYLAPPGRVAHWVEWRLLGMTKEQWQAVHTIFAFLFVLAAILHLYFNWKIFWGYLKERVRGGIHLKKEIAAASVLTLAIFALTLAEAPPFSSVVAYGEYLTQSWSSAETEPPVPHAEELTLGEYATGAGLDPMRAAERLTAAGLSGIDTAATMGELAEANGTTPRALGDMLGETSAPRTRAASFSRGGGSGYGRMTVAQVAEREGIPLRTALRRLRSAGIPAEGGDNIRALASGRDLDPIDVVDILKGSG